MLVFKKVEFLLNVSCKSCGKIMFSDAEIDALKRNLKLLKIYIKQCKQELKLN